MGFQDYRTEYTILTQNMWYAVLSLHHYCEQFVCYHAAVCICAVNIELAVFGPITALNINLLHRTKDFLTTMPAFDQFIFDFLRPYLIFLAIKGVYKHYELSRMMDGKKLW